jgi:NOL1/NOP2/sun family putative RNA methylase
MEQITTDFLKNILETQYAKTQVNSILEGLTKSRKTTIRVNTIKTSMTEIKEILEKEEISFKEVPWNDFALIIENADESRIRKLQIYNNGEIYMQSLSSMIPPIVLNPQANESILDMAAAPGGKTTEMACLSNNQAMITACEKNKIRCDKLKYNLEKQGANRVTIMQEDARKLSDFFKFDKILLDAPCSGSGTINITDSNLEKYFSKELYIRAIKTQKELLEKAAKIVKIGGEIVYSTCSILKDENEKIVQNILNKNNFEIVPINMNITEIPILPTTIEGTLCVCPTKIYEGFYVAKIKKIK